MAFEDSLFHADVEGDRAAIERGFAPDAIFVHASGRVQTKADYLAATHAPSSASKSVVAEGRSVRIIGEIGLVRGIKRVVVGELHLSGTYLTAYLWHAKRWQMLWSQSSPELQAAK